MESPSLGVRLAPNHHCSCGKGIANKNRCSRANTRVVVESLSLGDRPSKEEEVSKSGTDCCGHKISSEHRLWSLESV